MAGRFKVIWSSQAKEQADTIYNFIRGRWSKKEAEEFLDLIAHFELTISQFPKSFRKSRRFKNCRLGLVHRNTTAIYKIVGKTIEIVTVFDNRSGIEKQ